MVKTSWTRLIEIIHVIIQTLSLVVFGAAIHLVVRRVIADDGDPKILNRQQAPYHYLQTLLHGLLVILRRVSCRLYIGPALIHPLLKRDPI